MSMLLTKKYFMEEILRIIIELIIWEVRIGCLGKRMIRLF